MLDDVKSRIRPDEVVPLSSTRRAVPIHPIVHEVKLPTAAGDVLTTVGSEGLGLRVQNGSVSLTTTLNPITLKPFTIEELRSYHLEALVRQYSTSEAAEKAREDTARDLRKMLDDNERKSKEIERDMDEKEKTREIERKVYARKLGKEG
ncbi:hypothetical protein LTR05_005787 [Lithohypha guttulata]|uniref:Uncharacterized protein n=1 Tax=Lithohypha guttulata TaxID=1690604 RepID=A0AAN7SYC9_9EURO|nr:hypothetical protein LTR05_005787 [Lithohypha guttulata]